MMKLEEVKRSYRTIYSLGQNCGPANLLEYRGLRPFSGVLDWMISPALSDVNRLLKNRFEQFLELDNLSFFSYYDNNTKLQLKDNFYNIYSCHDFTTDLNTPDDWPSYPLVKEKYDRRVKRFLNEMETSESLLFIRIGGTYEEAAELQDILKSLVRHDFCVLLITNSESATMTEEDWGLRQTCVLKVHISPKLWDNYEQWNPILDGITLIGAEQI